MNKTQARTQGKVVVQSQDGEKWFLLADDNSFICEFLDDAILKGVENSINMREWVKEKRAKVKANAEYLAQTWNCHEELVTALELCTRQEHNPSCLSHGYIETFKEEKCDCFLSQCKQVLFKAKGA